MSIKDENVRFLTSNYGFLETNDINLENPN
jgi:hypothetical protein